MPDSRASVPRPEKLELTAEGWKRFSFRWKHYVTAAKLTEEASNIQVAHFLMICGADAEDRYKSFTWADPDDAEKIDRVLARFQQECIPDENTIIERYVFNSRAQKPGEPIADYVAELRRFAASCKFESMKTTDIVNELIRDKIVCGLPDAVMRTRLLEEGNKLTLDRTIEMLKCAEQVAVQNKVLDHKSSTPSTVSAVRQPSSSSFNRRKGQQRQSSSSNYQRSPAANAKPQQSSPSERKCQYCGRKSHPRSECPAREKECHNCKRTGHWSTVCRSPPSTQPQKVSSTWVVNAINTIDREKAAIRMFHIGNKDICFLVDSGAEVNILSEQLYRRATGDAKLSRVDSSHSAVLACYGGKQVVTRGTVKLPLRNLPRSPQHEFHITQQDGEPIIGLRSSLDLGLLQLGPDVEVVPRNRSVRVIKSSATTPLNSAQDVIQAYPDVFDDKSIGDLGITHRIQLDPDAVPVTHAQRRVPEPIRDKVKATLDDLVKRQVIGKVSEPTDWVSSLVALPKKDESIRCCMDCKDLNNAVKREHYTIPTYDEVSARLARARKFSLVDAAHGFWHIKLDEQSSRLCTFNTPFGRYRWKRMPFGLKSAPEVFQKHLINALEGLQGILVCADDILVVGYGNTEAEVNASHDRNFNALMIRCRQKKIRLSAPKLKFKLDEVIYMGHRLTVQGMGPDPAKVSAILDMPPPKDLQHLRGFIFTVTYLARYLPRLSTVSEPLRQLLKKDVEFQWTESRVKAFDEIKELVTSAPILQYYDPKVPVSLQCDASQYALGASLIQNGRPVAYASRSLTSTEKNYAQIEKELLAIVFGCNRFDHLIFGLPIVYVETDHKPLEAILRKSINDAPNKRLQRMILRLQRYALETRYVPGPQLWIADTLSRQLPESASSPSVFSLKLEKVHMASELAVTPAALARLQAATAGDCALSAVITAIRSQEWSDPMVSAFAPIRSELSTQDGLVFKSARLVIPKESRANMLEQLHASHMGIEATRRRAREVCFWPGVNADIDRLIKSCSACAQVQSSQPKEPMQPHDVPGVPWQKVGMDFFELRGQQYLIMTDYFTNWFEVAKLSRITAAALVKECRVQFARYGVPRTVVADSGTQFLSAEFNEFATKWDFEVTTSSPHYHQSNGKAENAVKTVKHMLRKCLHDGSSDPLLAILEWRNTPSEATQTSPAQRLFGRRCRTPLPTVVSQLQPDSDRGEAKFRQAKALQAEFYNRSAKALPPLSTGQTVSIQVPGSTKWIPGTIAKPLDHRSYEVAAQGSTYRRNRRHLRPSLCEPPPDLPPSAMGRSPPLLHRNAPDTPHIRLPASSANASPELPPRMQPLDAPPAAPPPLRRSSRHTRPVDRFCP